MKKYTTKDLKEKILLDKEISEETKDQEKKKTEISNEAFAICDFLEQLIKKGEHMRISSLMRK